jgi:hypothetical protein
MGLAPPTSRPGGLGSRRSGRRTRSDARQAGAPLYFAQGNLQIRRPVLFLVEAAPVDVAGAPEQQVVAQVDEVELHEVLPFGQPNGANALPNTLCGSPTRHGR